jgi:hypothetical protein
MKLRLLIIAAALAGLALFASKPVYASPISIGNNYGALCSGANSDCSNAPAALDWLDPGPSPWTFTGAASITLIDCCSIPDQYSLFDGVDFIGTSALGSPGCSSGSVASLLADPNCGRGTFALGSGSHSLRIQNIGNEGISEMNFIVARATPEPASMLLLGAGLLGLRVIRRRRNQD